ncbi:hypothetical protein LAG90_09055 [Marinilongibacter aquaticus]|uniref:hypothetical protein n=1 Tax=Marinilongibacter aquaticus TaxID=2975157 RepID=UPI0021BD53EC|nr:hypothetical protein [Marinilongibacter aquaticus]UBM60006.1 hypothetical protein LAG90_05000 [Marinilongibacter aquaticus]UBM60782.1 hypothetical protein LAG90_09055 [Marinilongibacter aquaticus]
MDKVRYMLYKLMSRTLTLEEFETWLYNDEYVKNNLPSNGLILELLSINLRSKHALWELEKFCFENFSREECILEVVRSNCEKIRDGAGDQAIGDFISNIGRYYDWDEGYCLVSQVYWLGDEWSMAQEGYCSKSEVRRDILEFALVLLEKLDQNLDVKVLVDGIELSGTGREFTLNKTKKWFEFWK